MGLVLFLSLPYHTRPATSLCLLHINIIPFHTYGLYDLVKDDLLKGAANSTIAISTIKIIRSTNFGTPVALRRGISLEKL
jgi:hypothetical protein